ncbi:MAG: hypothetical protein E7609_05170 [Ruminococcaceae bacterium]|nr:hypothetical protein [Oscillospiraceae bacterium]
MNKGTDLCATLPAFTLLLYLFLSETPAVWLLFFSALAFHEWGHLCAFRLLRRDPPTLYFEGVGARLSATLPLLPWEEAVVVLTGPLFNIFFALLALRFGHGAFFLLAAAVHLLFGIGNLLPFGASDGERLLRLFFRRFFPRFAECAADFLCMACLAVFFYFSLFLYYLTGDGLCGVFFALFFLLGERKSPAVPH